VPDPDGEHDCAPARRALITGLAGQDGSFLAELLLERGYEVSGVVRPGRADLGCSEHLRGRVSVQETDLLDFDGLRTVVRRAAAHEIYHLAAPSFVPESWRVPSTTLAAIAGSTAVLLEEVRAQEPRPRLFVAGSGTMFGDSGQCPQHERTQARPLNPYSVAKLAARTLVGVFRAEQEVFACCGIAYNHESERRPERFVTRRVSRGVAAIKLGLAEELVLGDLDAVRDWSFAGDVMRGAWLALQHGEPMDYILASGTGRTVRELVEVAFAHARLDPARHVRVDETLRRPPERTPSVGDPSRARELLGWEPAVSFAQLVGRMVDFDLRDLAQTPTPGAGPRSRPTLRR
jgi:GDPmannose 4,6-dehydratase